ncbi:DNA ligase 3 [Labeo rohita]|uniref:DNA ligase 3 n=1 Tax=Labeo rohita TaxID=84645 RepID=A0ABQ8N013_LABRO|nr:DNA ligase 3 [Labeo rohita]
MPSLIPPSPKLSVYPKPSLCPDLSACLDFPPSLSCLFHSSLPQPRHLCLLTAPLPTLSPQSVRWARRGFSSFHRFRDWRIPHLRLQPPSPGLHLCPPIQRLHPGSCLPRLHRRLLVHQLHWAPSFLRLCLGRSSSRHCLRTPLLRLRLVAPSSSASVICHSGSATDSVLALQILCVAWTHWLSVSASGSTSTRSSTMAPPSVGSAVCRHHSSWLSSMLCVRSHQ